ncbi:MAG: glycosyltransferase family 2 protein [Ferruginibacter sp.]|nr:glycosyltransferase family 2 protein [Ferruginibacter sp.]
MISQNDLIGNVQKRGRFRGNYITKLFRKVAGLIPFKHNYLDKPSADFIFLTICGANSLDMVKTSLYSFLKNSDVKPLKVVIVSDGTWDTKIGEKLFSDFKVPFIFESWTVSAEYYKQKKQEDLYTWAHKQIWGKKLAAILRHAESSLVLFSDSDVIWYKNPITVKDYSKEYLLKLSQDNSHNYDTELIKKMNADFLYQSPPVNCGIVLIKGDMFALSNTISQAITLESKSPGSFSEQTLLALLVQEFGEVWPEEEITTTIGDILSPIFKISKYPPALKARHYVWNLKWLYWRDVITKL